MQTNIHKKDIFEAINWVSRAERVFIEGILDMTAATLITLMDLAQHGALSSTLYSLKHLFSYAMELEVTPHAIPLAA